MKIEDKIKIFELELSYIKDEKIKEFTKQMIGRLPDYFFKVASSSSGRYHPAYAGGEGGLSRHVCAATRIAIELFRCEAVTKNFNDEDKDMILASLLLHDGCKHGIVEQKYTIAEHPLEMVNFCEQQEDIKKLVDDETFKKITEGIKYHMGYFVFDYKSKREVLPKPTKGYQNFIHMCDYLASRKCLEFNFDAPISK